ncbi:MAG TPA: hypothetical protein PKN44_13045, partial [Bacteroidales bacterium]|nr:hypothetical protein [Bacteroidales bacterium]
MKRVFIFFFLIVLMNSRLQAQQSWLKNNGKVYLYENANKVGIGTSTSLTSKVTVQSVSGETPLVLRGYSSQKFPFVSLQTSRGINIWRLYAKAGWWGIGDSFDSTSMIISAKPGWFRFNASVMMNSIELVPTEDSPPTSTAGRIYVNSEDSTLHYYQNGSDSELATTDFVDESIQTHSLSYPGELEGMRLTGEMVQGSNLTLPIYQSISLFFKFNSLPSGDLCLFKIIKTKTDSTCIILKSTGAIQFKSGGAKSTTTTAILSENTYYHVVCTIDSVVDKIYIGGALSKTGTDVTTVHTVFTADSIVVSTGTNTVTLVDLKVCNFALTPSEVLSLYNNGRPDQYQIPYEYSGSLSKEYEVMGELVYMEQMKTGKKYKITHNPTFEPSGFGLYGANDTIVGTEFIKNDNPGSQIDDERVIPMRYVINLQNKNVGKQMWWDNSGNGYHFYLSSGTCEPITNKDYFEYVALIDQSGTDDP